MERLQDAWYSISSWFLDRLESIKPDFVSKKPHFSFITVHYFWIIGATIVASILIYAPGRGKLAYIDALMFASGANTQAGLNPVDLNDLLTFQQVVIYLFTMLSNPITLHGCVVFLRLYWFEKRFQGWVKDARQRRGTISKSKSRARSENRASEEGGVQGRDITIVAPNGVPPRITNDGILLQGENGVLPKHPAGDSGDSDTTTVSNEDSNSVELERFPSARLTNTNTTSHSSPNGPQPGRAGDVSQPIPEEVTSPQTAITFASTVKRSDGLDDDLTNFAQRRTHADHIAILERQRNQQNDEVLRIPGPRDAERGLGPTPLGASDNADDDELARARTYESRPDHATVDSRNIRNRQPTITITEPKRERKEEIEDDAAALGRTVDALRLRKPRIFNHSQSKVHEPGGMEPVHRTRSARTFDTIRTALSRDKVAQDMPYLSYTPTMGRNSNFVGLTLEQREELGGIEYRSLRTLALILIGYFWGFELLSLSFLLPYILHHQHYGQIVEDAGQSRTWWGFWTANSAFMDLGFTLTPDSMISFKASSYVLTIMAFFIVIGNTGFPVMLRFVIWVLAKVVPRGSGLWEELRFLLDHPRRCFTLLFPSGANWWLFWILVALNVIDVLFFLVLDIHSVAVETLPFHSRLAIGIFQAASTRTAGFSAVNLSELAPAMPVLYIIMMYISVFPIAISIRRTNVYEEKSLGVYYHDKKDDDNPGQDASAMSYVGTHLRRQLSFDLWYVFLGFFVLAISEGNKIKDGKFDLFACLFEIVSAYGTVGLSIGVPYANASLCSQFNVLGKLVIVAMQIRGRHRGLPYGLDRAVLLPSEARFEREAQEAQPIPQRTNTMSRMTTSGTGRRGSVGARGRSRSVSRDRNIITSFLHPGPAVPRHSPRRSRSSGAETLPQWEPDSLQRSRTAPAIEDDDDNVDVAPEELHRVGRQRRAETLPVG